ncbi:family 10 glycosylhydrolase [Peptostreptococcus faecalis]|uniref:family 10 glycosylhydrolase n=1 Tax=Peptostreptococcus faecalis TaxID=2045015 RepID=UPI000C7E2989|nr:family 10 glycosylhydrolase [Peptostreptococcus faecalis]
MKKIITLVTATVLAIGTLILPNSYNSVKADDNEMRAAWISTVYNIDWPSKGSYGNPEAQKREYVALLDKLKEAGINTAVVQVRPESDAIYKSEINPWSRFLTGTQGKSPGYDPLQFIIQESHKRGIKVHAWFNPYRASVYSDKSSSDKNNALNKYSGWAKLYNNKWYYDPGNPEVVKYIVATVSEVVKNYDIDGVHFDDYFYPGANFPDDDTFKKYGSGSKDNWRRNNVNNMIKQVKDSIKSIKSDVDFGVSPAGIWRNVSNDPNGSNTSGGESYVKQYADTRYWIKNNLVDYVVPQVYWKIGHSKADYATLVKWWAEQVKGTNVDLYIGQGIYKHGQSEYNGENVAVEIKKQIELNRKYPEIKGSMFFSARDIVNINQVFNDLKSLYENTVNTGDRIKPYQSELMGQDRAETAIKISQRGWTNGSKTAILVNGNELVSSVVSSPLAASYDAPILLSFAGKVSDATINEMKRLGVENLIILGNDNSIMRSDIENIEKKIPNIFIDRIYGINAQEQSKKVADRMDSKNVIDTIYIASEDAMVDVLSIASKAGYQKNPILISSKNGMSEDNLEWLKNKNVENIYFIGGPDVLSDNVITQVEKALNKDLKNKRINGKDRIETNSKVIETFYKDTFSWKAFLTRSSAPIDAITVSAFAQRSDSPVILAGNSVGEYQSSVLNPRSASLVYKIGGGINENTYKKIYSLLEGEMRDN